MSQPRPLVLIFLSVLAIAALAQQPVPPQTPPAGQTAASQPRLASFNIVALDTKGRPITDLHPGDLKIEDNGKPLPITFFKSIGPAQGALPEPPKQGEYSNAAAQPWNTTVILFDLLNEGIGASSSGTNELITALQHAESPERIALIILTRDGKFFAVHDFGPGAAPQSAASDEPWTAHIRPVLDKAMNDVINHHNGDDRNPATRATDTFNALSRLTYRMSSIPGRKTLIWVTAGVPLEFRNRGDVINFGPSLQKLAASMDEFHIAAYAVRQSGAGAAEALGTQDSATLDTFTQLTGGRSYPSDYVGQALTDSATDARASYRIGYYPSADYWNDKFHKIRVTSTRPDVRIRTVSGFTPLIKDRNTANDMTMLTAAGSVPSDLSEIGLRATVSPGAAKGSLHFQIMVKPADLPLEQNGEKLVSQLTLAFLEYESDISHAPSGSVLEPRSITPPLTVKISLTSEQLGGATPPGIAFGEDVTPVSSIRSVRLVIYNRAADEYGTVTIPVMPQ